MMFPMIPQYFFAKPSECGAGFSSGVADKICDIAKNPVRVRKKFKIIVASVVDVDVESASIPVDELLRNADEKLEEIRVYSEDNVLKTDTKTWSWLKQVPLAEDCHSCNVILYQESACPIIKIKTVRKILPGEELVVWFSGELLSILQIPHLLPNNILSEKQYICHKCRFQCEMPNPVKIHLSLECGKLSKTILWNRLRDLPINSNEKPISPNSMSLYFDQKLEISKPNSAFKPYKKAVKEEPKQVNESILDEKKISPVVDSPKKNETIVELNEADILYQQAVEMETIVSNLGRFKQGHLCVFCGKVYSRKYGLKIHTRTHTGFRPLKCKFCLRPFGDPSNLNKHVRLHSEGNTPYKCELCGKILVRKRDLERHMKSRH
ncbi:zinc finger protein 600-like [Planococcus citri]|uniref:zinc finger protein 600-like n=1 Tax=Planococcus citri TaxID=170843 RepID=UPI0031F92333